MLISVESSRFFGLNEQLANRSFIKSSPEICVELGILTGSSIPDEKNYADGIQSRHPIYP